MTVQPKTETKTESISWNVHEIIPPTDKDDLVSVHIYSTASGKTYLPIKFYGYEYWVYPSLWRGTDVSTNDIIRICFTFPNERLSRNMILPSLRQGDLFIDVGAMYGSWTLPVAAMHCDVVAFESDSYSSSVLKEHVRMNEFDKLVQVISDHVGKKSTNSIDKYKFPNVRLIKIDTEGTEFDVLSGAKQTINRCEPNVLVELHTQIHGKTPEEEIKFFTKLCPRLEYQHYIKSQKTRDQDEDYYHIYHYL